MVIEEARNTGSPRASCNSYSSGRTAATVTILRCVCSLPHIVSLAVPLSEPSSRRQYTTEEERLAFQDKRRVQYFPPKTRR